MPFGHANSRKAVALYLDTMVKLRNPASIVLAILLFFIATIDAQVEKRVVFAKGKSSATLRGNLPRNYADYDAYVVRARRGQTLSVKLTSSDPNAYITVYETKQLGPDEDMISAGEDYPRAWSGRLPITSEYVQRTGLRSEVVG
jgi:hypothetical protein